MVLGVRSSKRDEGMALGVSSIKVVRHASSELAQAGDLISVLIETECPN